MVRGLPLFRDYFKAYSDQYALIGGTACDVLFDLAGLSYRATKDFDIVLIVEALTEEFVKTFWGFIKDGEYNNRQRSTGNPCYYRFHTPGNDEFPKVIELFSRIPEKMKFEVEGHLTPIPLAEELSSLSAIVLNEDYYKFVRDHCTVIQDIPIIKAEGLIPLKAKAWLDQTRRKNSGEEIQSSDIIKHRNDVFRLYQLLIADQHTELPLSIFNDLKSFLDQIRSEVSETHTRELGIVNRTTNEVLAAIDNHYYAAKSE